jgi:hypothetical protein
MDKQNDLFRKERSLSTQAPAEERPAEPADKEAPLYHFAHPYPRFGLAYTFFYHDIGDDFEAVLADEERLASLAADVIDDGLNYVRLHTEDRPSEDGKTELSYRYVSRNDLEGERGNDQDSDHFYYMAPHVATGDTGTNRLIKAARTFRDQLREGKKLGKSTQLKRSFSPFTAKVNAGTKSLSNPKTTRLQAAFTLVATLARYKPASQIDFTNQVVIPDLDLTNLIRFIRLFKRLRDSETGDVHTRTYEGDSKYYRPPIFRGNYPDAPQTQAFGPVGLIGAMGRWIQRAGHIAWAKKVVQALTARPLYLVSHEQELMKQAHVGHHVAGLSLTHDLPKALRGLYRAQHYNPDDNTPDSPNRRLFYEMAGRFLQFYTRPAFRDFLAFRVQYEASFSPILEDYFMNERQLSKALVQSARAYGAHLNLVAYLIAKDEVENKETGRDIYQAKSRALAQMESTAMSSKSTSALFGRLNRDAGQQTNRDAPAEAGPFMEAAIAGEIELDAVKELVLAFMRLQKDDTASGDDGAGDDAEAASPSPEDKMMGGE